ncbi:MAG TPA: hypothetical protein VFN67_34270 [Polyangiales bacterium]|jgi:hypothetical protein|nr:hypothetical protein [Polyangiales bacterium]
MGPPSNIDPSHARYERAIVIGASMAGLAVARALSDHFREVVLVERDALVTKGLQCGEELIAQGELGASASAQSSWPAVLRRTSDTGRTGTSQVTTPGRCKIQFDKWYITKGATVPYYNDPSHTLPGVEEPAMGSKPGWEDWDEDTQPGITLTLSGAISGRVFVCGRAWHVFAGEIPVGDAVQTFMLADDWNQELNVLGYEGSDLLTTRTVRAADPSLHFAELARLTGVAGTGDDDAICADVRSLAASLTPSASAR